MTDLLYQFSQVKALVIGDLMMDEYLWGTVERISPEAPVPVVLIEKENLTLGGAGNVINNLCAMNAEVSAVGTIGSDDAGNRLLAALARMKVETCGIFHEPQRPTTRKTRVIASHQQVVRIDKETCHSISHDTRSRILGAIREKMSSCNLVIISDYGKGLVTRELVDQVTCLARKHSIPVLTDPKSRDFSKYNGVTLLTPNQKEAALAAHMSISSRNDLYKAGQTILANTHIDKLVITCGKDGMVLFERNKKPHCIASLARQVYDVSGAGDTVISFLGLGIASGRSLEQSAQIANAAAGIVVAKLGTATVTPEELSREIATAMHHES